MSKATTDFAETLLSGRGIKVSIGKPNTELGSTQDPSPYKWTVETTDNETLRMGEHEGIPGAKDWLEQEFVGENSEFFLRLVTSERLPRIRGNGRSTSGKGDIIIAKTADFEVPAAASVPLVHAYGMIEIKTDKNKIRPAQTTLQIASLSEISRLHKSVTLLATDCNTQWELYHFKDSKTIHQRSYKHGRKCWEDFQKLLDVADTKDPEEPPRKQSKQNPPERSEASGEDEQNLDGFDIGDCQQEFSKMKAIERHTMLNNLANRLAEIYGERPSIPEWARAEATCPDYYA